MIKQKEIINNYQNKINNYSIKMINSPNKKSHKKGPNYNKLKINNLSKINHFQLKLKNSLIKSKD